VAHLPSGKFNANAAWLTIAAIARNLPQAWHREQEWHCLWEQACGPSAAAA